MSLYSVGATSEVVLPVSASRTAWAHASSAFKVSMDFVKRHSAPAILAAKTALNFMNRQLKKPIFIVGFLGLTTLGFVARKVGWKFCCKSVDPAERSTAPITENQTNNFDQAFGEWADFCRAYEEKVESTKKIMRFFIPATLGASLGGVKGAHGIAAGVFSLLYNVLDVPFDYGVRGFSHISTALFPNTLGDLRAKTEKAWENLLRIISEKGLTIADIEKVEEARHVQLSGDYKTKFRNHIKNHPKQKNSAAQEKKVEWIGDPNDEIEALINQINHPEDYEGIDLPRGIMMLGDPGLGKSYAAKYIAQQTGCPFESIKGPDLTSSMWIGSFGRNVSALYEKAAEKARQTGRPAIVFIDEADAILQSRNAGVGGDGYADRSYAKVNQEILDTLFPLMDGTDTVENVITIFASNMSQEYFDKALIERTKRISTIIHMDYPSENTCRAMLVDAIKEHPQEALLLDPQNSGLLDAVAEDVYRSHFSQENLYGLMRDAARTSILNAQKQVRLAFAQELIMHPEHAQQIQARLRQEMHQAQTRAIVTPDVLRQQIDIIRDRRRQGVQFVAQQARHSPATSMPIAIPACLQQVIPPVVRRPRSNSFSVLGHGLAGLENLTVHASRQEAFAALRAGRVAHGNN